jgi:hypothetical protein
MKADNWISQNARNLMNIYLWAKCQEVEDPATFRRLWSRSLFMRYIKSSKITEAMVSRHIDDTENTPELQSGPRP